MHLQLISIRWMLVQKVTVGSTRRFFRLYNRNVVRSLATQKAVPCQQEPLLKVSSITICVPIWMHLNIEMMEKHQQNEDSRADKQNGKWNLLGFLVRLYRSIAYAHH